jgi:hypothetical protein
MVLGFPAVERVVEMYWVSNLCAHVAR